MRVNIMRRFLFGLLAIAPSGFLLSWVEADDDLVIADFESQVYAGWTAEGEAFGSGPARGTLPGQMHVSGFLGKGLVNSFLPGDRARGSLTSAPLTIERDYLNFLIGGGMHPGKTCINLLIEGKVVRTATGPNDRPGGSERLDWSSWDVRELRSRKVVLQIVDDATGGWGHINVDQIVQSDQRAKPQVSEQSRELVIDARYLLFPIDNDGRSCRMQIVIDGAVIQNFDINLAADDVDWWAFLDLSRYAGKTATLQVDKLPTESKGLDRVAASNSVRHTQELYNETLRPQLRFSQMRGWNNDPNGMVYYDGEYHFFWQSNPFGPKWANMFWGHSVSTDLVHWTELPVALYPRVMAVDKCFSGSAHVDQNNSGGWQSGNDKTLVAAFTDTGCGEALAVSTDRGRNWEYIKENPVIDHNGRDPNLLWYEPGKHWVIAVYDIEEKHRYIAFYKSTDLKNWERTSRIEGFHECPELFELPVDGDPSHKRWVLFAADARYFVGTFDGERFTPDHEEKYRLHYGPYYASQCFSQAPNGRVIQIGWARINMPGMPFNQAFSLPTELTLKTTSDGVRLCAEPIRELDTLRGEPRTVNGTELAPDQPLRLNVEGQLFDVLVRVRPGQAREISFGFGTNVLVYHTEEARLDDMPLSLDDGLLEFRVVIDRPMAEVVGGAGRVYKTIGRKDGGQPIKTLELTAKGGSAQVESIQIFPMKSIWKR